MIYKAVKTCFTEMFIIFSGEGRFTMKYTEDRNPIIAMVLSLLFVGLGQLYNGDIKKGAVMFGAAALTGMISFGLGWFAVAVWSAIDAYRVANREDPLW
jgi:TM2 domain-containing membrane protein YozV